MTGVIVEVMYKHLEGILPEEQKGCRTRRRGTKDQLLIDRAIIRDCKRRPTNPWHGLDRLPQGLCHNAT